MDDVMRSRGRRRARSAANVAPSVLGAYLLRTTPKGPRSCRRTQAVSCIKPQVRRAPAFAKAGEGRGQDPIEIGAPSRSLIASSRCMAVRVSVTAT